MGFERVLAGRNSSKTILYLATPTQFVILIHLQKVTCHVVSFGICLFSPKPFSFVKHFLSS